MNLLHRLRAHRAGSDLCRALLAVFFACALVAAQAHLVVHEFSHWQGKAPPAETWSCADCLLGHALDTPLTATPPPALAAQFGQAAPAAAIVGRVAVVSLLPRARGPPA